MENYTNEALIRVYKSVKIAHKNTIKYFYDNPQEEFTDEKRPLQYYIGCIRELSLLKYELNKRINLYGDNPYYQELNMLLFKVDWLIDSIIMNIRNYQNILNFFK